MDKKDFLILVFGAAGCVGSRTKVQKIVYLLQEEARSSEIKNLFTYEPYFYGPFSEDLAKTVELLKNEDILEEISYESGKNIGARGYEYKLKGKGIERLEQLKKEIDPNINIELKNIVREYNFQKLENILRYIYLKYPEMKSTRGCSF